MTTTILNQGDLVFYVPRPGDRPKSGHVIRVTKTQVRIKLSPTDGDKEIGTAFKREGWQGRHPAIGSSSYRNEAHIYPVTDENEQMLIARADKHEADQEAKEAERKRFQRELNEERARELAEVRAAMNAPITQMPALPDIMPDGSRIYTVDIPVKPEYAERKKNWERVIVRCWDGEEIDWRNNRMKPIVESAYTYCNGSSCSFSSVSTNRTATDEEAVWDAIRSQYHRW